MADPPTRALLVEYYRNAIASEDFLTFQNKILARYTEGTLERLLRSGDTLTRRAATSALGLVGTLQSNDSLGDALRDDDQVVRAQAEQALWSVWFRARSPDEAQSLAEIRDRIAQQQLREAIELADRLIARAPDLAEAHNQRAIAHFLLGHFAKSAADCRAALERNPVHFGALGGLAQCQIKIGDRHGALESLKRLSKLRPYSPDIRLAIESLESATDP
jgi:tetratricopeptide (TPR) repeat protein